MKKFLDLLSSEVGSAFEKAGYEKELGRVTISNRPDLCEYQCNGAMAGAKKYKKAPKARMRQKYPNKKKSPGRKRNELSVRAGEAS